jgi:hypothetical protein
MASWSFSMLIQRPIPCLEPASQSPSYTAPLANLNLPLPYEIEGRQAYVPRGATCQGNNHQHGSGQTTTHVSACPAQRTRPGRQLPPLSPRTALSARAIPAASHSPPRRDTWIHHSRRTCRGRWVARVPIALMCRGGKGWSHFMRDHGSPWCTKPSSGGSDWQEPHGPAYLSTHGRLATCTTRGRGASHSPTPLYTVFRHQKRSTHA